MPVQFHHWGGGAPLGVTTRELERADQEVIAI